MENLEQLREVGKTAASVIIVYSTHYAAEKIYDAVCVPDGFVGFFQGLFTMSSPWCKLTLSTMTATETAYTSIILVGVSRLLLGALGL